MSSINSIGNNREEKRQKDISSYFLEKHVATRKIVAYGPAIVFGISDLMERVSSYKLLSRLSAPYVMAIFFFSGVVAGYDRSLQNRKIERLN